MEILRKLNLAAVIIHLSSNELLLTEVVKILTTSQIATSLIIPEQNILDFKMLNFNRLCLYPSEEYNLKNVILKHNIEEYNQILLITDSVFDIKLAFEENISCCIYGSVKQVQLLPHLLFVEDLASLVHLVKEFLLLKKKLKL